tara:strand:+ start:3968 stop:5665 length:1698 start_codon:yes stop_codon:yes gene_type:complete
VGKQKTKQESAGRRISFYIRVSTEEQASNPEGSIKNQEERLRMAVKLKNMEGHFGDIVAVYVDRAKSGKDTNRPELQKLLMAIRKRETDLVLVSELSRISRSIKDFSDIWQMMKDNGCGFQSLRENFDTTTAAGEMVLFTVANIAQFERRQISERVSANFNVRSQRGLFNGGAIPFGYKRILDKPGYLEVDEDAARSIRVAFKAYVTEGSLSLAAKWLNANGYRMKIEREGGGIRSRLGYFTTGNLKAIVKSKFYIGIRSFQNKGVAQEVEAVWPGIVDIELFRQANLLLNSNHRRNKENMESRYPYILPGLIFCKCCGDRLIGKSAHGKREKIGYYEHALSTKRMAIDPSLKRGCFPYRTLAKIIEPCVWRELENLITSKNFAEELLNSAQRSHRLNPGSKEIEKYNQTIFSTEQQIEILAERLSVLPKEISATPIFKQMEKLESLKRLSQEKLNEMTKNGFIKDIPCDLKTYEAFLDSLKIVLSRNGSENMKFKTRMIRTLVDKILVTQDGLEIYFKIGSSYVASFLEESKKKPKGDSLGSDLAQNLGVSCSSTCQIGVTNGG